MPKVFLSGYAKLPDNTTAQKLYSHLVLVVTAEMPGGIIQDADCTMATELGRRFIRELLTGAAGGAAEPNLLRPPAESPANLHQRHLPSVWGTQPRRREAVRLTAPLPSPRYLILL